MMPQNKILRLNQWFLDISINRMLYLSMFFRKNFTKKDSRILSTRAFLIGNGKPSLQHARSDSTVASVISYITRIFGRADFLNLTGFICRKETLIPKNALHRFLLHLSSTLTERQISDPYSSKETTSFLRRRSGRRGRCSRFLNSSATMRSSGEIRDRRGACGS